MQAPDLNDIGNPATVSFIPDGPGWYVLITSLLIILILITWFIVRHQRKNKYRREAIRYLESIASEPGAIQKANELMKRICLTFSNRRNAALTGQAWIDFLNSRCKTNPFDTQDVQKLASLYYEDPKAPDLDFLNKTTRWVKEHGF